MRTLTSKPIDFGYPPTANEIMNSKNGVYYEAPLGANSENMGYSYSDQPQSIMGQSMYNPSMYDPFDAGMSGPMSGSLDYFMDTPLFMAIKEGKLFEKKVFQNAFHISSI